MNSRPDGCQTREVAGLMVCDRCAMRWELTDPNPPACDPMTFKRMRLRLLDEVDRAQQSAGVADELRRQGLDADPLQMYRRAGEMEALLRLFDRATGSAEGREFLNRGRQ